MSLFGSPEWFFAGSRRRSLFVAEPILSASFVSEGYTFNDISIGSPAANDRTVIVVVSCKDVASILNSVDGAITLGGLAMPVRNAQGWTLPSGAELGVFIFSAVMGASYGTVADLVVADIISGSQIDSLGVTVLATQREGNNFVDGGGGVQTFGTTRTLTDIATAGDGYVVGGYASESIGNGLVSFNGNGSTGALTEVTDSVIASNHRHAVAFKSGLSAGTAEDFTATAFGNSDFVIALTSRQ